MSGIFGTRTFEFAHQPKVALSILIGEYKARALCHCLIMKSDLRSPKHSDFLWHFSFLDLQLATYVNFSNQIFCSKMILIMRSGRGDSLHPVQSIRDWSPSLGWFTLTTFVDLNLLSIKLRGILESSSGHFNK